VTYGPYDNPYFGFEGHFEKGESVTEYVLSEICYKDALDGRYLLHLFCETTKTMTAPTEENQITVSNREHNDKNKAFPS
jgi:hypothetical protein